MTTNDTIRTADPIEVERYKAVETQQLDVYFQSTGADRNLLGMIPKNKNGHITVQQLSDLLKECGLNDTLSAGDALYIEDPADLT